MLIYPINTNQNRKLTMAKPNVPYNVGFFATAKFGRTPNASTFFSNDAVIPAARTAGSSPNFDCAAPSRSL